MDLTTDNYYLYIYVLFPLISMQLSQLCMFVMIASAIKPTPMLKTHSSHLEPTMITYVNWKETATLTVNDEYLFQRLVRHIDGYMRPVGVIRWRNNLGRNRKLKHKVLERFELKQRETPKTRRQVLYTVINQG